MEDLDNLAGLAAEADINPNAPAPAGAVASGDAAVAELPPGPEEQALDAVNFFAGLMTGYAPEAAVIWSEEARQRSAAVIAPLMVKYNFSMMAIPPELSAAIVVGPLLYQSAKIVAVKMRADRAANDEQKAVAGPPGARQAAQAATPQGVAPGATEDGSGPVLALHPQMALYAKAK